MSLTPQTRHLINDKTLALAKPGFLLVNTGRRALVDTKALMEALESGKVGGALELICHNNPRNIPQAFQQLAGHCLAARLVPAQSRGATWKRMPLVASRVTYSGKREEISAGR